MQCRRCVGRYVQQPVLAPVEEHVDGEIVPVRRGASARRAQVDARSADGGRDGRHATPGTLDSLHVRVHWRHVLQHLRQMLGHEVHRPEVLDAAAAAAAAAAVAVAAVAVVVGESGDVLSESELLYSAGALPELRRVRVVADAHGGIAVLGEELRLADCAEVGAGGWGGPGGGTAVRGLAMRCGGRK